MSETREPWQDDFEQSVAKIDALCANKKVMDEICGRTANTDSVDSDERYEQNIDSVLVSWSGYTEKAWSL